MTIVFRCFLSASLVFQSVLLARNAAAQPAAPGSQVVSPSAQNAAAVPAAQAPAKLDAELAAFLQDKGFRFEPQDGSIEQTASKKRLSKEMLKKGGLLLSEKTGRFVFEKGNVEVERQDLPGLLKGLLVFVEAGELSEEQAGAYLRSLGMPRSYDRWVILNPDGTATYIGMLLCQGLRKRPDPSSRVLSGERLSKVMEIMNEAYSQAFSKESGDLGAADLARAWGILAQGKSEGETPLELSSYPQTRETLEGYEADIERAAAQGKVPKQDAQTAVAGLKILKDFRVYPKASIRPVPEPKQEPNPPVSGVLPVLLRLLDKINGKPLSSEQVEALFKSLPMGELLWRMRAHELWRAGLSGKGVKVAVIDDGVGPHPEFGDSVKARENFTPQRGRALYSQHATHVAAGIHAFAPDAELRSYKALDDEDDPDTNMRLYQGDLPQIVAAIHKAVADGNQIINMSLSVGNRGALNLPMTQLVEEYARKGVLFIVSAGNDKNQGIGSPSIAPSAVTVGSVDARERLAFSSSRGTNDDALARMPFVKRILLAPGVHIMSANKNNGYSAMSGTSMAAEPVSGVSALLLQGLRDFQGVQDPLELSRRIQDAFFSTGKPISRKDLPTDVEPDQEFILMDPAAAWRRLSEGRLAARGK